MTENPLDALPEYSRVSFRAVLVPAGEDPAAALAAAGIVDPISLPVVVTDSAAEAAALLGTGATPHLVAVLEYAFADDDGFGDADPSGHDRQLFSPQVVTNSDPYLPRTVALSGIGEAGPASAEAGAFQTAMAGTQRVPKLQPESSE